MGEIAGVPGLMDVNSNEHAVFHDKITQYAEHLKDVIHGKEKLDGEKVKTLIDSVMPELDAHLRNEIDTLVDLEKYDKVDWDAWFKKEVGQMIKELMGQYGYRVSFLYFAVSTKKGRGTEMACGRTSPRFRTWLAWYCVGCVCTEISIGGGLLAVVSRVTPRSYHLPREKEAEFAFVCR